jgi:hypothetical protein
MDDCGAVMECEKTLIAPSGRMLELDLLDGVNEVRKQAAEYRSSEPKIKRQGPNKVKHSGIEESELPDLSCRSASGSHAG